VCNKLRKERKITEEFEVMMNNLTLEELIAVKLELATKTVRGKLYGIPIWHSLNDIVKDAVLKYALSATRTQNEAARFLGLNASYLNNLIKKYGVSSFFEENDEKT
tara:strand:- start:20793 stop:21110 length:318 start_codon:yes stop_codon:yes gene_type:complete